MRVKFVEIDNPENVDYKINWQINYKDFPLTIDKEYIVYAIECLDKKHINYFLLDDGGNLYPNNYPSDFFIITDDRMSKYWVNRDGLNTFDKFKVHYPSLITFKEWVCDAFFEEDMMENNEALKIFNQYKKLIDIEFPDKSLPTAILISDNWVMCNFCDESWIVSSENGIVICPNCKRESNNPLWEN